MDHADSSGAAPSGDDATDDDGDGHEAIVSGSPASAAARGLSPPAFVKKRRPSSGEMLIGALLSVAGAARSPSTDSRSPSPVSPTTSPTPLMLVAPIERPAPKSKSPMVIHRSLSPQTRSVSEAEACAAYFAPGATAIPTEYSPKVAVRRTISVPLPLEPRTVSVPPPPPDANLDAAASTPPPPPPPLDTAAAAPRPSGAEEPAAEATTPTATPPSPTLAARRRRRRSSAVPPVRMQDLVPQCVLGIGTFGKVKLVTWTDIAGNKHANALKCISKETLHTTGQVESLERERNVLTQLNHPFICQLRGCYQDKHAVYLMFELVQGGELFEVLARRPGRRLPEDATCFFAACVLEALMHVHSHDCLYRDLKPENVMIDFRGYIRLIDFGFAKQGISATTILGTPDFMAPEMFTGHGYGPAVDRWAFGCLVFEMLAGRGPFSSKRRQFGCCGPWVATDVYKRIRDCRYSVPRHFSPKARALVKGLLSPSDRRIGGSGKFGNHKVRDHPFFEATDFAAIRLQEVTPPLLPEIRQGEWIDQDLFGATAASTALAPRKRADSSGIELTEDGDEALRPYYGPPDVFGGFGPLSETCPASITLPKTKLTRCISPRQFGSR